MARTSKKMLKEDSDNDKTVAQKSLHPNSNPDTEPKTMPHKSEMLAKMIGAGAAMTDENLVKYFNSMMAYHNQVGHGMGVGDNSGHNKSTLDMKASAATSEHSYGDVKMPMPTLGAAVKESIKQDVNDLLSGQELSEEFKAQATTLFEAAIEARVHSIELELTESAEQALEEQVKEITTSLVEGLDTYLDYVGNEWMKENEVAIESSLRNELASEFITGLRNLFTEHNFNIPEDEVEVVDTMAQRIDDLETRLNDALLLNAELSGQLVDNEKKEIVTKLSEGLTLAESEKLKKLAENVDAENVDEYVKKVNVIKESNFVKGTKKSHINESMEEVDENNKPEETEKFSSPEMAHYAAAISRSLLR